MPDQRALLDQIKDVHRYAIDQGMYDAADWIKSHLSMAAPGLAYALGGNDEVSHPGHDL